MAQSGAIDDSRSGEGGGGAAGPLRVLLVDDQKLVRSGFELMLSVEDDIEVVGEASDGLEAVERVAALRPDVVLMDVQMPRMDGIEATERILAGSRGDGIEGASEGGAPRVVILTTFDRDDYVFAGLRAGASGFLLKNCEPDQLVEAIRAVGHGHSLLAPEVTKRVIERMVGTPDAEAVLAAGATGGPGDTGAPPADEGHTDQARDPETEKAMARLTDREREVLALLARGRSNAEIAKELFLGEATIKTHVSNCLSKLHLRDRVQAVVFAYEARLIQPGE
ncbi:DNA-binding NarL/FixJ family response regulator [Kineosphaera limosa]|nr:response regulator transcription factor [Kineosphaera limosa]NYE01532.1 DNA-binding NarL/FixJ family response regulator [Kineosphaera limosa]